MAFKIHNNTTNTQAQTAKGTESAYQTLLSSGLQKLFASVLDQAQGAGQQNAGSEINSLNQELQDLQGLPISPVATQTIDPADGFGTSPGPHAAGLNSLATSALLELTATSHPGAVMGGNLSSQYLKTLALESIARAGAEGGVAHEASKASKPMRDHHGIGGLSARFESGEEGLGVIGYDVRGGTSYGQYQIASRVGTMRQFLNYLEERAPEWAERLKTAGPANTGSRQGAMPAEWKEIAAEDPSRFAKLQHDFIAQSHYAPALEEIFKRTGVNVEQHSKALQEVLWSTAVQHGPRGAANIFCEAIEQADADGNRINARDLIDAIYTSRAGQFGPSAPHIRAAVQERFHEERAMAVAMLGDDKASSKSPV